MDKFEEVNHGEGVWRKVDDLRCPTTQFQTPKAITVTNESCWHVSDMIPNPPESDDHQKDAHYKKMTAKDVNKTKIIMAHEFREDSESYDSVRQQIADSYNDAHALTVGEKPPIGIEEK